MLNYNCGNLFTVDVLVARHLMKTEHDLLELDHTIKSTLQLSSADPDRCIALFSDYKGT